MLNLNNPMDCFIANGGFDRALHQINQAALSKAVDHEKTNA